ncbi:MAG: helix-turn-helix domain-containing protein [Acidimicrobiales bacterium]
MTLAEVSARCGIGQPALSRLENGHSQNPTLGHAPALRRSGRQVVGAVRRRHPAHQAASHDAERRPAPWPRKQRAGRSKGSNQGPLLEVGKG